MPLLFSYGTLQEEKVQLSTFGRLLQGQRDELPGFEQSLVGIEDAQVVATSGKTHHANVTFNGRNDSRVSGTVFEITDTELAAADQYEKLAAYIRIAAMLASGKQAWLYVDARSAPVAFVSSTMLRASEALARLREGNRRFASNQTAASFLSNPTRRAELMAGQEPFAVILGCSDSRVPAELVFDQGFGDLFVIRVAGNVVAPSQVGSVEFAASRYGTRLVVVMGHSQCGAVIATLEELQGHPSSQSRNLRSIVNRVRPSVESLFASRRKDDADALLHDAVRANVRSSADHLRHGSELLEQLIQQDGLVVVGAEYSLETGVVDFFDGCPERRGTDGLARDANMLAPVQVGRVSSNADGAVGRA